MPISPPSVAAGTFLLQLSCPYRQNWFQISMLDENVSPAADQPESCAVGQPPCNACNPCFSIPSCAPACWTAQVLDAFQGLRR
eukprot:1045259-Pelagomonas_calceolata.AAC.1